MRFLLTPRTALALVVAAGLLQAAPLRGADSTFTLYIPTSASIHGNAGTFFHTDLWAFNRAFDHSLTVNATYHCFTGPCADATRTFVLGPRVSNFFTDVGGVLFGNPETAGAIEMTYPSPTEDLVATTRTYTPSAPLPTNGTAIPALSLSEARTRALFLGLASNGGNLTAGFRTNAGAFNPGPFDTVVTYTLFDDNGRLIGSTTQSLATRKAGQITDIFNAAGAGSTVTTNAVLVVTSPSPVFPFVTVIDNQSGDSVYAAPSSDLPGAPSPSLITNGNFDTGLEAWTRSGSSFITMAWSPTDSTGDPGSGSMIVTNTSTNGGVSGPVQCVFFTPGRLLNISLRTRIPSGQSGTGTVNPLLFTYASSDCTGAAVGVLEMRASPKLDTWETLTGMLTVPEGNHSFVFKCLLEKTSVDGTVSAYFDDISVVSSAR